MSKYNSESKIYEPFEQKLQFPEKSDPNAHWSDVWATAFVKSAHALVKGEGGVPLQFGLDTLKFAEKAGESLKNGSVLIKNDFL